MKKALLFLLSFGLQKGTAQTVSALPKLPFRQSITASVGVPLLNEKDNNRAKGMFSILPSRSVSVSVNLYKGFSLKGGLWRASYLSPDLPPDYAERGLLGDDPYRVYNVAKGSYGMVTYDYFLPLVKGRSLAAGMIIQPGLGIGFVRLEEAQFTPHISTGGGMGFFNFSPTHDYTFLETSVTGFAAQLGVLGYLHLDKGVVFHFGSTFFTMPGNRKRIYGADIGLGFSFALSGAKDSPLPLAR